MCLIIFAHNADPNAPLIVAANRDEFHARPTAPSQFWPETPNVLAGRDLQLGGTWMGISESGRFAAVTNFRDPAHDLPDKLQGNSQDTTRAPRSRGELPLDFLTGTQSPANYLADISARSEQYAGFNLLVGDLTSLWYLSNAPGDTPMRLAPGVYGLSNARLNTQWPKVTNGKQALAQLLDNDVLSHDALATVVSDRRPTDSTYPHDDNLPAATARLLSAQFILSEGYGTRATTTLWVEKRNTAHWRELSFDASGRTTGRQEERFTLGSRSNEIGN